MSSLSLSISAPCLTRSLASIAAFLAAISTAYVRKNSPAALSTAPNSSPTPCPVTALTPTVLTP